MAVRVSLSGLVKNHPQAVLICLSLGFLGIWMNLVGYSPNFLPEAASDAHPDGAAGLLSATRSFFYVGLIVCGLALAAGGNRLSLLFQRHSVALPVATALTMSASTVAFYFATATPNLLPPVVAYASCLLSGICYSIFGLTLYVRLAVSENSRNAIIAIAASLVMEMVLADLLDLLAARTLILVIGALMPLAIGLAILLLSKTPSTQHALRGLLAGRQRAVHIALVFIAGFSMVVVMASRASGPTAGLWGTRTNWMPDSADNIVALLSVVSIFFLLTNYALIRRLGEELILRYSPAFAVIATGCILIIFNAVSGGSTNQQIQAILISAIELFSHLVTWSIFISLVRTIAVSGIRVFGLNSAFCNLCALAQVGLMGDSTTPAYAAALLAVFVLVATLAVLPSIVTRQKGQQDSESDDYLLVVARHFGLSPKETEIFELLAQGRNRPYICERLHLAEGTVKTHTTHIYRKLEVHSRQDMLDLLQAARANMPPSNP
jgi:DNA-binding CsgD family transcriptional regulator